MIDFRLTAKQQEVVEKCKELAKDFAKRASRYDADRLAPEENYNQLREAGLFGMVIPEEYGGLGIGFLGYVHAIMEIAKACASTANSFNMHINALGHIFTNPKISEEMRRKVADLVINQGKLICASVSEPSSSSLLAQSYTPSLVAEKVPGGYILNGKKVYTTMVESSDFVYLYVHPKENPDPKASISLLVPIDRGRLEGVTIHDVWDTLGMRATRSNVVEYNNVFVPDEWHLFDSDDFLGDFIIRGGTWSFGGFTAVYLGVGLGILDYVVDYLTTRKAKGFAQPQGYHPDNRRRVGDMAAKLHAAKTAVIYAAWHSDTYGPTMETFHHLCRAKYLVGLATPNAAQHAKIVCGITGLMKDKPLERMIRDAATAPIMPPNIDATCDQVGLLTMNLNPDEVLPVLKMEEHLVVKKEG